MPSIIPASTLSQISSDIIRDGIEKVVVGAVIIFEGGRALMVRRSAGDFLGGLVELPSGTVDSGESLIDALIREVREETGLTLTSIDKFVGTFDYTSGSGKRARQVNFRASAASENVILSPEHSAFYILPIEELAKLENVSEKSLSIIKSALA
ncbi:MAG: NUDIX hydrolase [Alphaproteobacteria bacterium]|nr:NUDIX hydrolase [Alphaproteobacteria bacterium]